MTQHVFAIKSHLARGRLEQPCEDAHQRCFACTVGAQEPEHSFGKVQVDSLKRRDRAWINLHEITNREHALPRRSKGQVCYRYTREKHESFMNAAQDEPRLSHVLRGRAEIIARGIVAWK